MIFFADNHIRLIIYLTWHGVIFPNSEGEWLTMAYKRDLSWLEIDEVRECIWELLTDGGNDKAKIRWAELEKEMGYKNVQRLAKGIISNWRKASTTERDYRNGDLYVGWKYLYEAKWSEVKHIVNEVLDSILKEGKTILKRAEIENVVRWATKEAFKELVMEVEEGTEQTESVEEFTELWRERIISKIKGEIDIDALREEVEVEVRVNIEEFLREHRKDRESLEEAIRNSILRRQSAENMWRLSL